KGFLVPVGLIDDVSKREVFRFTSECSIDGGSADTQDVTDLGDGHVLLVVEFLAVASLSPVSDGGRPPTRPRARAAASPALVRSVMMSRSNSAREAKMWKTSRPPGEVVSMFSCRDRNSMPRSCSSES